MKPRRRTEGKKLVCNLTKKRGIECYLYKSGEVPAVGYGTRRGITIKKSLSCKIARHRVACD